MDCEPSKFLWFLSTWNSIFEGSEATAAFSPRFGDTTFRRNPGKIGEGYFISLKSQGWLAHLPTVTYSVRSSGPKAETYLDFLLRKAAEKKTRSISGRPRLLQPHLIIFHLSLSLSFSFSHGLRVVLNERAASGAAGLQTAFLFLSLGFISLPMTDDFPAHSFDSRVKTKRPWQ